MLADDTSDGAHLGPRNGSLVLPSLDVELMLPALTTPCTRPDTHVCESCTVPGLDTSYTEEPTPEPRGVDTTVRLPPRDDVAQPIGSRCVCRGQRLAE